MLADRIVDAQERAQAAKAALPVGNARADALYKLLQNNENVQRTLQMIRSAEGTQRYAEPERVNFGNSRNSGDLSAHPNILRPFNVGRGQQYTSATGAYQFLGSTWAGAQKALGLPDFSRKSQDIAALYLIQQRGALKDAEAGNVPGLARKLGGEWASLGFNNYGQPTRGEGYLRAAFDAPLAQGGTNVAYAPDKGGKVGRGGAGNSGDSSPAREAAGVLGDRDTTNFLANVAQAHNSPFVSGEKPLLQTLMEEDAQRKMMLMQQAQQQTPQMTQALALGAPITFGG